MPANVLVQNNSVLGFTAMAGFSLSNPETGQTLRSSIWLNALFPSFVRNRFLVYSGGRTPRQSRQVESCDYQRSLSNQIAFARLLLRKRGLLQSETGSGRALPPGISD